MRGAVARPAPPYGLRRNPRANIHHASPDTAAVPASTTQNPRTGALSDTPIIPKRSPSMR